MSGSAAMLWLRQAPGHLEKAYQARRQRWAAAYHGAFGPLRRLRAELRWRVRELSARQGLTRAPLSLYDAHHVGAYFSPTGGRAAST